MKNNILTKAILCLVAAALIASAGFALGLSFSTSGSPEPEEHTVYVDKPVAECSSLVYGDAGLSSLGTEAELDLIKAVREVGPYEVDTADWLAFQHDGVTLRYPATARAWGNTVDAAYMETTIGTEAFPYGDTLPSLSIAVDGQLLPDGVIDAYGLAANEGESDRHHQLGTIEVFIYKNAPGGLKLPDTSGLAKFYARDVVIDGVRYEMSEYDYFGGGETYLRELVGYLPSGDLVFIRENLTSPYGDYRVRAELTFRVLSEILKSLQVN